MHLLGMKMRSVVLREHPDDRNLVAVKQAAAPLKWPWPITTAPESRGGKFNTSFADHDSGLWLCGYWVGSSSTKTTSARRYFLDYYFRNQLPAVVKQYHGGAYGEPGSEERLQKMANTIAANCRNFKRLNREKYKVATSEWEQDLGYLKARYYRAGSFPWPPTAE
jgi:hypothetical protein